MERTLKLRAVSEKSKFWKTGRRNTVVAVEFRSYELSKRRVVALRFWHFRIRLNGKVMNLKLWNCETA